MALRFPTLSKTSIAMRNSSRRESKASIGKLDHSLMSSVAAPKRWKESALHLISVEGPQTNIERIDNYHWLRISAG